MLDLEGLADEIEAGGARFADALAVAPDPAARAGGLEWSIHQLGAHAATGVEAYALMVRGEPSFLTTLSRREDLCWEAMEREAATPVDDLVTRIRTGSADIAATLRAARLGDRLPFYEHEMAIETIGGMLLAELLVHCHDLAGLAPPERAAALAGLVVPTVLPLVAIPGGKPQRTSIAFKVRGYGEVVIDVDQDHAWVRDEPGGPVDARLSARPPELLLTAYRRMSAAGPLLRGWLSVTGRRPWRLRALYTRFESP